MQVKIICYILLVKKYRTRILVKSELETDNKYTCQHRQALYTGSGNDFFTEN